MNKSGTLNPKHEMNSKSKIQMFPTLGFYKFEFVSDFKIRV